jgi:hypothetical protein
MGKSKSAGDSQKNGLQLLLPVTVRRFVACAKRALRGRSSNPKISVLRERLMPPLT